MKTQNGSANYKWIKSFHQAHNLANDQPKHITIVQIHRNSKVSHPTYHHHHKQKRALLTQLANSNSWPRDLTAISNWTQPYSQKVKKLKFLKLRKDNQ